MGLARHVRGRLDGVAVMDLARELIAAQSHRRMIDPTYFAKRVTPFVIQRASFADPLSMEEDKAHSATIYGSDRGDGEVSL
jgi:hypothetical protein